MATPKSKLSTLITMKISKCCENIQQLKFCIAMGIIHWYENVNCSEQIGKLFGHLCLN